MKKKKYNFGGSMNTSDLLAQQFAMYNQGNVQPDNVNEKTIGDRMSNAAKYGALGAKLGTIVPGVGNVVGGIAGAGIGMMMAEGGSLTEFEGGGTHEENPLGGIPVGDNALVEEDETMVDFDFDKYVFSNRIKIPGKSKTFAQESKSIRDKISKDRPHDKAAKRAVEKKLALLADKQEEIKAKKQKKLESQFGELGEMGMPQDNQMYFGGQIGLPKMKILSPGGSIFGEEFTTLENLNTFGEEFIPSKDLDKFGEKFIPSKDIDKDYTETSSAWDNDNGNLIRGEELSLLSKSSDVSNVLKNKKGQPIDPETKKPLVKVGNQYMTAEEYDAIPNKSGNTTSSTEDYNLRPKNDKYLAGLGTLAQTIPNIYNLRQGLKGSETINLDRPNLENIDLGIQRDMLRREAGTANRVASENIRRLAPSSSGALAATIGAASSINKNLSSGLAESRLNEDTTNVGINNQQEMVRSQISNQEKDLQWRTDANTQRMIETGLAGIGQNVAMGIRDYRAGAADDRFNNRLLKLLRTQDRRYNPVTGETEFIGSR